MLLRLTDLMNESVPAAQQLRFTAALANGRDLYAFRYAVNDHANSLYYRESRNGVVIVSEPLDRDPQSWTEVPDNHVVIARAGERLQVRKLVKQSQDLPEFVV